MNKPADRPSRPSLYNSKGATPTAYSVLDAATVQGLPRRRAPLPEPKPAFRKQRWLIALVLLGTAALGTVWWLQGRDAMTPAVAESGNSTVAITPPSPPKAAAAAPIPTPDDKPDAAALVEQLEAPPEPVAADPLKDLDDDASAHAATKPAKAVVAKPHIRPVHAATHPASKPGKAKEGDEDVSLIQSMLSHMGHPHADATPNKP